MCDTIGILSLDIVIEDCKCLVDFLAQFVVIVNPKVILSARETSHCILRSNSQRHQFGVVHFQEHPGYLASQFWLQDLDLGIDGFAK